MTGSRDQNAGGHHQSARVEAATENEGVFTITPKFPRGSISERVATLRVDVQDEEAGRSGEVIAVVTPTVKTGEYRLTVVDGPDGMVEVIFRNEAGEVILHDLELSEFSLHWATVSLAEKIAEAFIRDVEGL